MLLLKNTCRSFGVPAKLDVRQKDTVVMHEIPCITACKECRGVGCENGQHLDKSDNNIMFYNTLYCMCNVTDMHILFCIATLINHIIQICSGITYRRVLNGELYAQRL